MTVKNIHSARKNKKSLFEWLLSLCGYKIWSETHSDPRIKGPQPRVLTSEQVKRMEKFQQTAIDDEKGIKE